jgi:hypothetical protein
MYTVAIKEGDPNYEYKPGKTFGELPEGEWIDFSMAPIYYLNTKCKLQEKGKQVVKNRHTFGELEFLPGDELHAWRSYK